MSRRNLSDSDVVLLRGKKESETLKRFARKITKIPESIHVYSNPLMKKREK